MKRSLSQFAARDFVAQRIKNLPPSTVFSVFTALAIQHQAINLGQGFPDFVPDSFILEAGSNACLMGESKNNPLLNQYTRSQGHLRLCKALAAAFSKSMGREIDPMTQVVTTVGATEALFCAITTFVNPGEEVIVIEPFYDMYPADTIYAGAVPVYVPLHERYEAGKPLSSAHWVLDPAELAAAITPKTKAIVINTPQNVPGKVWSRAELSVVAELACKHDLLVIADQVYEHHLFDGEEHVNIATLPGMWDRTVSIGSAGKTFSVTGWKIGWAIGPTSLIAPMATAHVCIPFSVATPLQEAVAVALETAYSPNHPYFSSMRSMFAAKRKLVVDMLNSAGLPPIIPQGSYFVLADISGVPKERYFDPSNSEPLDYHFCRWLTKSIGVTAIPCSPFYNPTHAHLGARYVRFAACKTDASISAAAERLKGVFKAK